MLVVEDLGRVAEATGFVDLWENKLGKALCRLGMLERSLEPHEHPGVWVGEACSEPIAYKCYLASLACFV